MYLCNEESSDQTGLHHSSPCPDLCTEVRGLNFVVLKCSIDTMLPLLWPEAWRELFSDRHEGIIVSKETAILIPEASARCPQVRSQMAWRYGAANNLRLAGLIWGLCQGT